MAKSNKFDYSNEKTCAFQIFFVILCAEIVNDKKMAVHEYDAEDCIHVHDEFLKYKGVK